MRNARAASIVLALVGLAHLTVIAQSPAPAALATPRLSLAEQEQFLLTAKIIRTKGSKVGVTGTVRATLSDGKMEHDASIQVIDQFKQRFEGTQGTEFNFTDSWRYNVAAYRLDRLLDLGMIPPSVERQYRGRKGSYTWWVDDVMMDETERYKKKIDSPDPKRWNEQMWHVRMFDQLIYNVDRNLGNLVIDRDWTIWMIDHSRAFRLYEQIKAPGNLSMVDRGVLEKMKSFDRDTLRTTMNGYLTPQEIDGLLKRRDQMVKLFEARNAIFDWARPARNNSAIASSKF